MGILKDCRSIREMEKLSGLVDTSPARDLLQEFLRRHPGDARAATLLARIQSEEGELDAALATAERAGAGLSPWAARILKAEIHMDAGERDEARSLLREAREASPGNVAAEALLLVLDLEENGMRGIQEAIARLSPCTLWCQAVLSRLILALEGEMERRESAGSLPPGFHATRSVLIRPRFQEEMFRPFWIDRLRDLMAWSRSQRARSRKAREKDLQAALGAGEMARAREIIEGILAEDEEAGRKELLGAARLQALEIYFLEDRFPELIDIHRKWLDGNGDPGMPYPAALAGYSLIAGGDCQRCLEVLAPPLRSANPDAELLHLAAIAELKLGRRCRAAGHLRRAAARDDIAMVALAREEAKFLEGAGG